MAYPDEDVAELFEQACHGLVDRTAGLTDDEWARQPIADDEKVTVRWRLDHLAEAVGGKRNWEWLGLRAADASRLSPAASEAAVAGAQDVVGQFVALIRRPDIDLDRPIGPIAGRTATFHAGAWFCHCR